MQVARDGKEPCADTRVGVEPMRVLDQPQPRFFEQIFRDVMATRQAEEKRKQTEIEGVGASKAASSPWRSRSTSACSVFGSMGYITHDRQPRDTMTGPWLWLPLSRIG